MEGLLVKWILGDTKHLLQILETKGGEAEHGGSLYAKDEIAEGDRDESGGEGGCGFIWRKITFRADEYADGFYFRMIGESFAEILRILREGGDDLEFGRIDFADPLLEGQWVFDDWNSELGALFAGFERGAAPFLRFLIAGGDDGVAGDEGLDAGDAELDGFLDDPIHVFTLWDRLDEGDFR